MLGVSQEPLLHPQPNFRKSHNSPRLLACPKVSLSNPRSKTLCRNSHSLRHTHFQTAHQVPVLLSMGPTLQQRQQQQQAQNKHQAVSHLTPDVLLKQANHQLLLVQSQQHCLRLVELIRAGSSSSSSSNSQLSSGPLQQLLETMLRQHLQHHSSHLLFNPKTVRP